MHPPYNLVSATAAATLAVLAARSAPSQLPIRAAGLTAEIDALSTEAGGYLLAIPGVADDFVLLADGQWQVRNDGTARLTAYAHRAASVDRDFFVELIFDGLVEPGNTNYPPAGYPITTMLPAAYAPAGPVDTGSWVYYTQITGTMTGVRAFADARIDISGVGSAQLGLGATNKNVMSGLAVDFDLTIVQPPSATSFVPTGPASLRANLTPSNAMCATHVDSDPLLNGSSLRMAFDLPGVADDYLFLPRGELIELEDGTATFTASMRRQSDYDDRWELQLQLDQRVDPGATAYPPAGFPVQGLLPSAYALQGGAIDPDQWRYYTQVTGTLTGEGMHAGAIVQLTSTLGAQVGLGAAQGNVFYGLYAELQAIVSQQPASGSIAITADATLNATLATDCILPPPVVLTGDAQTIDSVTQSVLTFTGTDLGFVQLGAVGPNVFGTNDRNWLDGFLRVVDHETLELSIPQGLANNTYPLLFLNSTRASNQLSVNIEEPTSPTLATEPNRIGGEDQHWLTHSGGFVGPAIALVCVSFLDQPSSAPGIVDLAIGDQFRNIFVVSAAVQDPNTNLSQISFANVSPQLVGNRIFSQTALMGIPTFPLQATNSVFTDY